MGTAEPTGKILSTAVDWLTATAKEPVGRAQFRILATTLARSEEQAGNQPVNIAFQGYIGWRCGELSFGERTDGAILRLSGALAGMHWLRAMPFASNVSRLDLAVTVHYQPMPPDLASSGYQAVLRNNDAGMAPVNADLRIGTDGGETLYLGKRSSDKFARLYNKQVESKLPAYENCWRYELELKNRVAWRTSQKLAALPDYDLTLTRYVWQHFADRGVYPTFPPGQTAILPNEPRSRSAAEKTIAWLATQVRPAIERLTALGYRSQLLAALAIS